MQDCDGWSTFISAVLPGISFIFSFNPVFSMLSFVVVLSCSPLWRSSCLSDSAIRASFTVSGLRMMADGTSGGLLSSLGGSWHVISCWPAPSTAFALDTFGFSSCMVSASLGIPFVFSVDVFLSMLSFVVLSCCSLFWRSSCFSAPSLRD